MFLMTVISFGLVKSSFHNIANHYNNGRNGWCNDQAVRTNTDLNGSRTLSMQNEGYLLENKLRREMNARMRTMETTTFNAHFRKSPPIGVSVLLIGKIASSF